MPQHARASNGSGKFIGAEAPIANPGSGNLKYQLRPMQFLLSIPLIIVFSLVYAGTRHEKPVPIFNHALRFSLSVLLFMVVLGTIVEFLLRLKG